MWNQQFNQIEVTDWVGLPASGFTVKYDCNRYYLNFKKELLCSLNNLVWISILCIIVMMAKRGDVVYPVKIYCHAWITITIEWLTTRAECETFVF